MFLLRPSSIRIIGPSQTAASGTEEQLIPAEIETPIGPDLGSSIPDSYDIDFLRVLVQDPFSLYIYWELRQPTVDALTKVFPKEEIPEFQIVLRLVEISENHESFFNVGRIGSYWMSVFAGKKYRFEIGVRSPRRGYIKLIGSNEADTPRGTIAPETDRVPRFRLDRANFINILEASGFHGSEALVTDVEEGQPQPGLHQALTQLPPNIQTTIRHAATGSAITEDEIDELPIALREALGRIRSESGGKFASMALVHYLPELLRWLSVRRKEPDEGFLTPIPSAPRFMLGSSDMKPAPALPFDRLSSVNRPSSPGIGSRWNKPEDKS